MPERRDTNLFEILIGQVTQNLEVNIILGKALSVLPETELFEPVQNLLHRRTFYGFNAIRSGPACRGVYQHSPRSSSPGPLHPTPNYRDRVRIAGQLNVRFTPESGHRRI